MHVRNNRNECIIRPSTCTERFFILPPARTLLVLALRARACSFRAGPIHHRRAPACLETPSLRPRRRLHVSMNAARRTRNRDLQPAAAAATAAVGEEPGSWTGWRGQKNPSSNKFQQFQVLIPIKLSFAPVFGGVSGAKESLPKIFLWLFFWREFAPVRGRSMEPVNWNRASWCRNN